MDALEAQMQIDLLLQQGDDAYELGQYVTAETFFAQAAQLADEYADWPTRLRAHFWKADAQRMQGKREEPFATFTWIIGLLHDPEVSEAIQGNINALIYAHGAYSGFVAVGADLPSIPIARLYTVLDEAEQFLRDIGHPKWAHKIRLNRGNLLEAEGRLEEARREYEAALALRRRDPNTLGYSLGSHLNNVARILRRLNELDGAERYYREIWEGSEHSIGDRQTAASGLAWVAKKRQQWAEAEHWAREGVALAGQMEGPSAPFWARNTLIAVLLGRSKAEEARREAGALWCYGRWLGSVEAIYTTYSTLCEVRLACARAALSISANPDDELPEGGWSSLKKRLLSTGRLHQARRCLRAAERWLARAREPGRRLDEQAGVTKREEELNGLEQKIQALYDWIGGKSR